MAASRALHLTPSAVSHALKGLESQLGCRLFDRAGKRIILNQAGEQLLFHTKNWDLCAEARIARYDYPVQTVSATDLAKRWSTELAFNFRCERRVARFLKIFAEYERERVFSNLEFERYVVATVKGGLNWMF